MTDKRLAITVAWHAISPLWETINEPHSDFTCTNKGRKDWLITQVILAFRLAA